MRIRPYVSADAAQIVTLFYDTIHAVCAADYTPEQLHAWAPEVPDADVWDKRMARRRTLVAEDKDKIVAFAEFDESGALHMFYCRADAQRQGIGARLLSKVVARALGLGLSNMVTDASITARPFFERQGCVVVKQNRNQRAGIELTNFTMEKRLV